MPGEEDVDAVEARGEIGGEADAPDRVVAIMQLGPNDPLWLTAGHHRAGRQRKRGLGDHRDEQPTSLSPGHRRGIRQGERDDRLRRKVLLDHARGVPC